jgi:hypothetical protein
MEQQRTNRLRVKQEIISKYNLQKSDIGFKITGNLCPICNNSFQ